MQSPPFTSDTDEPWQNSPMVQMDFAFMPNAVTEDTRATFLMMIDTKTDSDAVTACQKKKHDKFVERFLLKSHESFGMSEELVLQTDTEKAPIDETKFVTSDRQAAIIIRQTRKKSSQSEGFVVITGATYWSHWAQTTMIGTLL